MKLIKGQEAICRMASAESLTGKSIGIKKVEPLAMHGSK